MTEFFRGRVEVKQVPVIFADTVFRSGKTVSSLGNDREVCALFKVKAYRVICNASVISRQRLHVVRSEIRFCVFPLFLVEDKGRIVFERAVIRRDDDLYAACAFIKPEGNAALSDLCFFFFSCLFTVCCMICLARLFFLLFLFGRLFIIGLCFFLSLFFSLSLIAGTDLFCLLFLLLFFPFFRAGLFFLPGFCPGSRGFCFRHCFCFFCGCIFRLLLGCGLCLNSGRCG